MFRPLEIFVGLRYTRSKRRNHFISFISVISLLGIAVGVTALITVLSVMNGFEQELRQRILGMVSHVTIASPGDRMENWEHVREVALSHPEVIGAAPYVSQQALLQGRFISGAMVRGVLPKLSRTVSKVNVNMVAGDLGNLRAGEYGIVLGIGLARALGVTLGDKLRVYAPEVRASPIGALPTVRRFQVVGIFEAGMHEYDRGLAIIHLKDAQRLFRTGGGVSGVRVRLKDMYRAWEVSRDLDARLSGGYFITDWTRQHANFFRAVQMEKTVMFVILSLIVAVAAFNIVSTLVMVVTDKQADIAILRTLGASPRSIMGVFIVQGVLIGLMGTVLGLIGGVLLALNVEDIVAWLEQVFNTQFMPASIYYISELPSQLRWEQVTVIGIVAFVMTSLATIYPAWRASRTDPAAALSYE